MSKTPPLPYFRNQFLGLWGQSLTQQWGFSYDFEVRALEGKLANGSNDSFQKKPITLFKPFPCALKAGGTIFENTFTKEPLSTSQILYSDRYLELYQSRDGFIRKPGWSLLLLKAFWYVYNIFDMSIMICLKLWSKIFVAQTICSDRPPPNFALFPPSTWILIGTSAMCDIKVELWI